MNRSILRVAIIRRFSSLKMTGGRSRKHFISPTFPTCTTASPQGSKSRYRSLQQLSTGSFIVYTLYFTKQAQKDAKKANASGLRPNIERLLTILEHTPLAPLYEKLIGYMSGAYSRRINFQHRLVYQILEDQKAIKIIRMWTHYE